MKISKKLLQNLPDYEIWANPVPTLCFSVSLGIVAKSDDFQNGCLRPPLLMILTDSFAAPPTTLITRRVTGGFLTANPDLSPSETICFARNPYGRGVHSNPVGVGLWVSGLDIQPP